MEPLHLIIVLLLSGVPLTFFLVLRRKALREKLEGHAQKIIDAFGELKAVAGGEYLATSQLEEWERNHPGIRRKFLSGYQLRLVSEPICDKYRYAEKSLRNPRTWASNYNRAFVEQRMEAMASWFDTVTDRPFTTAQRKAIVTNENNNLIVAAAGTGKTTTILGKVAYILQCGLAEPSEILVMAFNRKIAKEVKEKLTQMGAQEVEVATFHAKAYSILGITEGRKRAISRLAESDSARLELYQECLTNHLQDDAFFTTLKRWFVDLAVDPDRIASTSHDERLRKERSLGLMSISGVEVRSQSELKVADWLTLNGIRWEYETVYPKAPHSPDYRDYTPDFFLPDHEVWLEVWGCDRSGNMASHMDAGKYQESMTWKRELHSKQETVLLEVYQEEIWSGKLGEILANRVQKSGVKPHPLTSEERLQLLDSGEKVFTRFAKLIDSFLNLLRGGAWTVDEVFKRVETARDEAFLQLFLPFLSHYLETLAEEKKIDFHEMLIKGRKYLEDGSYQQVYKYIVVDEFQDASQLRLDLVRELRDQAPHTRVMLVGDDWQSIYRFAGSDLSLFAELEKHLGKFARIDLDMTFRLKVSILNVSTQFVTKNPAQLTKQLAALPQVVREPGVCVSYYDREEEEAEATAMLYLMAERLESPARILVLGRYRHSLDVLNEEIITELEEMGFEIERVTIHRAKGLEADAVLLLDLGSGVYGFPSEIMDDPVLRLLLSAPENFPNAEERRLFYVALTRTKNRVYLMVPAQRPSAFLQELLEPEYAGEIETIGLHSERYRCPLCFGKTIRMRSGTYGTFWACLNFPRCPGRLLECSECEGVLEPQLLGAKITHFSCVECDNEADVCPQCTNGPVVERNGKYGLFLACGNWRKNEQGSCRYTRNV